MFITRTVALHYGSCLKQNYGFCLEPKLLVYWKFLSCHSFNILIFSFCTIPSSSWSCGFVHLLCLIDICLFFLGYHELELVQGEKECQAGSAHLQAQVCGRGCRHKGRPGKEDAQLIKSLDHSGWNMGEIVWSIKFQRTKTENSDLFPIFYLFTFYYLVKRHCPSKKRYFFAARLYLLRSLYFIYLRSHLLGRRFALKVEDEKYIKLK